MESATLVRGSSVRPPFEEFSRKRIGLIEYALDLIGMWKDLEGLLPKSLSFDFGDEECLKVRINDGIETKVLFRRNCVLYDKDVTAIMMGAFGVLSATRYINQGMETEDFRTKAADEATKIRTVYMGLSSQANSIVYCGDVNKRLLREESRPYYVSDLFDIANERIRPKCVPREILIDGIQIATTVPL